MRFIYIFILSWDTAKFLRFVYSNILYPSKFDFSCAILKSDNLLAVNVIWWEKMYNYVDRLHDNHANELGNRSKPPIKLAITRWRNKFNEITLKKICVSVGWTDSSFFFSKKKNTTRRYFSTWYRRIYCIMFREVVQSRWLKSDIVSHYTAPRRRRRNCNLYRFSGSRFAQR